MYVHKVNNITLVSLLLTLNIFHSFSSVSIVNFEGVNVCWVVTIQHASVLLPPFRDYFFFSCYIPLLAAR